MPVQRIRCRTTPSSGSFRRSDDAEFVALEIREDSAHPDHSGHIDSDTSVDCTNGPVGYIRSWTSANVIVRGRGRLASRKRNLVAPRRQQRGRLGVRIVRVERRDAETATPRGGEHEELPARRHGGEGEWPCRNGLPRRSRDLQCSIYLEERRNLRGWLRVRIRGDDGDRGGSGSEPGDRVVVRGQAAPWRAGPGDRRRGLRFRTGCRERGRGRCRGCGGSTFDRLPNGGESGATRSKQQRDRDTGDAWLQTPS